MKINLNSKNQNVSKLKMIAMVIGLRIFTWISSSLPTIPFKIKTWTRYSWKKRVLVVPLEQLKETEVRRFVFHDDKRQAEAEVKGTINKM